MTVRADKQAPWHPGRCAAIFVRARDGSQENEWLAGYAGELHPRAIQAFGLPARTSAMELDMSAILAAAEGSGPVAGAGAVVVPARYPGRGAGRRRGGPGRGRGGRPAGRRRRGDDGTLLEDVTLFDVYTGAQVGEGRKSLAYTLRFRAPDRTLTAAEVAVARDAAVAEAAERLGATLRSA